MLGQVLTSLLLSLPLIGAYGIFAIGIVMIYRASRMLNLAHGAMAMVPAFLLYTLTLKGVPLWIGLPVAVASGAVLGLATEKLFVSRLRSDGSTAQTVGTVAALGIMVALVARFYGTASLEAVSVFPRGQIKVGLSGIQYGELGLFAVMLVVAAGLFMLLTRTDLGLMMRGTAESRLAASLHGVNPNFITSLTWALGGALAALAGILLAAVTTLHPYNLALQVLPAFIAALLGGLGSVPGALLGSAIVGVTQGLVPILGPVGKLQGAPQLFLALLALIVMAYRGKALVGAQEDGDARTAAPPAPADSRVPGAVAQARRRRTAPRRVGILLGLVAVVVFPFIDKVPSSVVGSANLAAIYTIIAVSVVLLTGWVGQISLGHAALVGVGAYVTGHVVAGIGIPFPLSLPLGAASAGLAAALLGGVALRVRGLYLAVATLVFSWMASEFLFRQVWFTSNAQITSRPIGARGTLPFFDFTDRRSFYLVAWATALACVFLAANLKRSKTGRAFFAIRGSEMAAASLGVDVMRYKLVAFAISGAIAGAAGTLMITDARVVTVDQFTFNISLFFLAIAVVGGLTSLGGAVASGLVFAGLTEVFFRVPVLGAFLELVSSLLLAIVLLAYRGGLASLPGKLRGVTFMIWSRLRRKVGTTEVLEGGRSDRPRSRWISILEIPPAVAERVIKTLVSIIRPLTAPAFRAAAGAFGRLPIRRGSGKAPEAPLDFLSTLLSVAQLEPSAGSPNGKEGTETAPEQADPLQEARRRLSEIRPQGIRSSRRLLVEAERVTVRFGGLLAVNDASLELREGEIVGLIGPNGAGKTTLFNAIAGYNNPTAGTIRIYGQDASRYPVFRRAQLGVARTFQILQLFSDLTVFENLLVATHVHNPTSLFDHIMVTRRSLSHERGARARVQQILELLELSDLADKPAADLPFGVLRMVEVARALVTGFRLVMLDEPASGLDNTETDRLMEVLRFVRGLGVTMLVIEHDVRMVTGVSDYMYVLDQGLMIAEGSPEELKRDPKVIAAYLGEPEKELAEVKV